MLFIVKNWSASGGAFWNSGRQGVGVKMFMLPMVHVGDSLESPICNMSNQNTDLKGHMSST